MDKEGQEHKKKVDPYFEKEPGGKDAEKEQAKGHGLSPKEGRMDTEDVFLVVTDQDWG